MRKIYWWRLPFVLLIRIPIILPLWILVTVGEYAQIVYDKINPYLPGLD